ncbi:hypothetical protein CDAR_178191 [Caerostris darwini]|uniref:Uncharacterized protein n=1 Tax=Caerostris darwini TaxID=1538125 RepID=A0AAV4W4M1_9ARAC|nr:hypothetical protein CDAR_178191 [Caerostris darwini]
MQIEAALSSKTLSSLSQKLIRYVGPSFSMHAHGKPQVKRPALSFAIELQGPPSPSLRVKREGIIDFSSGGSSRNRENNGNKRGK